MNRLEITNEIIPQLSEQGIGEIQHWLSRFILEVRKKMARNFHQTHCIIFVAV